MARFERLKVKPGTPSMEAKLVDALPDGPGWRYEPKWDGFRCLVFRDGDSIELQSKAQRPLGRYFPEVEAAILALQADAFVLDGELIIPIGGVLSFDALQMRLHPAASRIRRLAAEDLGLPTSPYRFVDTREEYREAVAAIGLPCVVKPVMSSSGHGQSTVRNADEVDAAWDLAQSGGRAGQGRAIVEGFVAFDYEITLLTVRHRGGTDFCEPVGHLQRDGDYRESWMPQPMSPQALQRSREIARRITDELGGWGLFGVELFVRGDEVWFSEVSPRPHDTGLVTLVSQDLSEFALHARAILGLPIPVIRSHGPSASCAVLAHGRGVPRFSGVDRALARPDSALRLFGKPWVDGHRRVAVTLTRGADIEQARAFAREAAAHLHITFEEDA